MTNTEEEKDSTDLEEPMPSQDLDEPMTSFECLENQLNSVAKDRALALCKKIEVSLVECTNTDAIVA